MNCFYTPPTRDLTLTPIHIVVAAFTIGLSVGCADMTADTQQAAVDEAVFAALEDADYQSVRQAFDGLKGRTYMVAVETREMDDVGRLIAQSVEQFDSGERGMPSPTNNTAADLPFSKGFLSFLTKPDSAATLRHAPLLPDRPAFADLRMREQFRYSSRGDTTISNTGVRLYEARAVAPTSKQPIRHAIVGINGPDSTLLYIRLRRHDDTIFYEERSTAELTLAYDSTGAIVPVTKSVEVTVDVPFEPARTFAVIQTYSYPDGTL